MVTTSLRCFPSHGWLGTEEARNELHVVSSSEWREYGENFWPKWENYPRWGDRLNYYINYPKREGIWPYSIATQMTKHPHDL